ncbi:MAG: hypothetical protein GY862_28690 [Gammaproteobacteria bacterium]|nr:hypothetical protein [Gammaproteobacteria bacterium]
MTDDRINKMVGILLGSAGMLFTFVFSFIFLLFFNLYLSIFITFQNSSFTLLAISALLLFIVYRLGRKNRKIAAELGYYSNSADGSPLIDGAIIGLVFIAWLDSFIPVLNFIGRFIEAKHGNDEEAQYEKLYASAGLLIFIGFFAVPLFIVLPAEWRWLPVVFGVLVYLEYCACLFIQTVCDAANSFMGIGCHSQPPV